jgi:hypothetical protein
MTMAPVRVLLLFLALGMASSEILAQACTIQGGNDAINADKPGMSSRGWIPRTYIAWCSRCGGTMSNGNCIGYKLESAATAGGATSGAAANTGNAAVDAAQQVLNAGNFNTNYNAAMTLTGALTTGILVGAMQGMFSGPSAQDLARRQAVQQEQARLQAEAAERQRVAEQQRFAALTSSMIGYQGGVVDLKPRVQGTSGSATSNLGLIKRAGSAEAITPFAPGSVTPDEAAREGSNLALLKRGDTRPVQAPSALDQLANTAGQTEFRNNPALLNDTAASRASTPFDSGATVTGALPPPPPAPEGKLVGPAFTLEDLNKPGPKPRSEVTAVLKDALAAREGAATTVKQEIARLETGPDRDASKIAEERAKLQRIEAERKSIEEKQKKVEESKDEMVDLSIGQAEVTAAPGKVEQ